MALTEAKCTNCGANIKVDPVQDAANCEYCGAAFIVEKAINNYSIANAHITAQTVNVNVGASDFIIEGGVLKKYRGNAKEVVIPDSVIIIQGTELKSYAPTNPHESMIRSYGAFYECQSIIKVTIPGCVTQIGSGAFHGCKNLKSITLLDGVEGVECGAFSNCPNVTDINIIGTIQNFSYAFSGCNSITNVNLNKKISVKVGNARYEKFTLPDDLYLDDKDSLYRAYNILSLLNCLEEVDENKQNKRPVYVNGSNIFETICIKRRIEWREKRKCYIATAVYGSYDAPQVLVLRRFRDEVLEESVLGRIFIKTYYRLSPPLARQLKNKRCLNASVRRFLDKIESYLSEKAGGK